MSSTVDLCSLKKGFVVDGDLVKRGRWREETGSEDKVCSCASSVDLYDLQRKCRPDEIFDLPTAVKQYRPLRPSSLRSDEPPAPASDINVASCSYSTARSLRSQWFASTFHLAELRPRGFQAVHGLPFTFVFDFKGLTSTVQHYSRRKVDLELIDWRRVSGDDEVIDDGTVNGENLWLFTRSFVIDDEDTSTQFRLSPPCCLSVMRSIVKDHQQFAAASQNARYVFRATFLRIVRSTILQKLHSLLGGYILAELSQTFLVLQFDMRCNAEKLLPIISLEVGRASVGHSRHQRWHLFTSIRSSKFWRYKSFYISLLFIRASG
ncbi:hypothetical protein SCHPADRAFT_947861 [Schizopora paradoxa]|uniref:Uncharacterized protein n=1 Tax=Schizopora paradoxa TaxID=27342 RepID=A0A0H2QZ45_9AGAM|nr:hypothetical protein SCHPADRAFT_947861 [Schizopora paradoxa]